MLNKKVIMKLKEEKNLKLFLNKSEKEPQVN